MTFRRNMGYVIIAIRLSTVERFSSILARIVSSKSSSEIIRPVAVATGRLDSMKVETQNLWLTLCGNEAHARTKGPSQEMSGHEMSGQAMRRFLQWFFRNRETGDITVAQAPNLVLWVVIAAGVLLWVFPATATPRI